MENNYLNTITNEIYSNIIPYTVQLFKIDSTKEPVEIYPLGTGTLLHINGNHYMCCDFLSQIESKCKEAERRMKKSGNAISIPATAFYITIIILVALSSFFVSMIVANAEILHSALIWKAVAICALIAISGTVMAIIVPKILDKWT